MKGRMKELEELITKYNHYYYIESKNLVSDKEYDMLFKELERLEDKYPEFKSKSSPTSKVGAKLESSTFEKTKHKYPMLSLDNTYNKADIAKFVKTIKKTISDPDFIVEYKFDGVSISIDYENGKLVKAVTRGNGLIGEDVTENVKTITDIPHYIESSEPFTGTIRGEIVMPNSVFNKLNEERIAAKLERYMNPRNTTSGTLRQHDPNVVKYRQLETRMYYIYSDESFNTQESVLMYLSSKGFHTGSYARTSTVSGIMDAIDKIDSNRKYMDVDTDGAVIKINKLSQWETLGMTARSPRYAIAYKYDTIKVQTKLLGVEWFVGRSGKVTPVAKLRTVEISGSKVSKATLHNYNYIKEKDLRIGDTVVLEKAAEVIPKILNVVVSARTGKEIPVEKPTLCVCCGEPLVEIDGFVDLFCKNPHCEAKLAMAVEHFISSEALNIQGFGPTLIAELISEKVINKITDIYMLPKLFANSSSVNKKKVGAAITASLDNEPVGLLIGLGIPGLGKRYSRILIDKFGGIEELFDASFDEISNIISNSVTKNIFVYKDSARTKEIMCDLKKFNVRLVSKNIKSNKDNNKKIEGFTFVLTGSMNLFDGKKEIVEIIESNGGIIGSGVSKKTDYLIYGSNAGSKLSKAKSLDVTCLEEEEFVTKFIK